MIFGYHSGLDALVYPGGPNGQPVAANRRMLAAMMPGWNFEGIETLPRIDTSQIQSAPMGALRGLPRLSERGRRR